MDSQARKAHVEALDRTRRVLERPLLVVLGIAAVVILIGAVFVMRSVSPVSGGRLYVALAAVLILGAVDTQIGRVLFRRRPIRLDEPIYDPRYKIISVLVLVASAILLIGLALYMP